MSDTITTLLSPALVGLSVLFVWPQVVRSFNSVEGLSLVSIAQSIVGSWLWVLYGWRIDTLPLVLANASAGVGFSLVLFAAVRAGAVRRGRAITLIAVLAAVSFVQVLLPATLLGWVAILIGATGILPQVAQTFRAHDHSGVSRPTYAMVVALTTGWSVFGVLDGNWLIVAPNAVILPSALYVLAVTRPSSFNRRAAATSASSNATV